MKQRIINYLHKHLLNAIVVEDVVTTNTKTGVIMLNGKVIKNNELNQLQAEIKALEGFRIWSVMTNSLRHIAQDKVFNKSLDFNDVVAGKLMLYNIGIMESIAKVIKNKK